MEQNRQYDLLREELELCPLPEDTVNARLRQVYAELPDSLPTRRHMPVWVKRGLCTAASFLAVCGLMLGINGTNPAFAESIPFVGSIFRAINDIGYNPTENAEYAKNRIAEYAVDVSGEPGSVITVPAGGPLEKPLTATLKEVYYDGSFVFAGLEFQLDTNEDYLGERNGPGHDILINGESQIRHDENGFLEYPRDNGNGFCDISDYHLTKLGSRNYAMRRAFRVPDHLQGADSLDITLCFEGFSFSGGHSGFELSFTVQKTEVPTRSINCTGVEQNGIRLISATSSPTVTYIVTEYLNSYVNPASGATFEDGIYIGALGGTETDLGNGWTRSVEMYAGLREDETRNLVWRLFDKNGSYQTEAVFVLDFQNGAAHVGSEADLKKPPVGNYDCGIEAVKNLTEGYIVEKYHAEQSKPMLYIASASGKRKDLYVEVWQDGQLVESTDTHGSNGWSAGLSYWVYGPDGQLGWVSDDMTISRNVWMMILRNGYAGIDLYQPLTIKAFDESGELVVDEEIVLEVWE